MLAQQYVNKISTILGIERISGEGVTNIIPENVVANLSWFVYNFLLSEG
jgi:hypothetical protein